MVFIIDRWSSYTGSCLSRVDCIETSLDLSKKSIGLENRRSWVQTMRQVDALLVCGKTTTCNYRGLQMGLKDFSVLNYI